jgi:diacylglycerol kinase (ATP)
MPGCAKCAKVPGYFDNLVGPMRAAAIFGPGSSRADLKPFQLPGTTWVEGPLQANADAVLVFGGDGTLHRNLSRLVELQVPLLVVPRGSGNDFARALHLRSWEDSLAVWREFLVAGRRCEAADLGTITPLAAGEVPRFFGTVAGLGIDVAAARLANRFPRWLRARGGYALGLLAVLFPFAAVPVKISADRASGDFQTLTLAAFANTAAYGGGMKIAPRARLDNGLLDVCLVHDIGKLKLLSCLPRVYRGTHLSIREVEYFSVREARVETESPAEIYADGEYVCRTPAVIGVKRAALPVIARRADLQRRAGG